MWLDDHKAGRIGGVVELQVVRRGAIHRAPDNTSGTYQFNPTRVDFIAIIGGGVAVGRLSADVRYERGLRNLGVAPLLPQFGEIEIKTTGIIVIVGVRIF